MYALRAILVSWGVSALLLGCAHLPPATSLDSQPLDELIALHRSERNDVERQALLTALINQLQAQPVDRLLQLRDKVVYPGPIVCGSMPEPLSALVGQDSIIVQGVLQSVEYDKSELIEHILTREADHTSVNLTLEVLQQYPKEPARKALSFSSSRFGKAVLRDELIGKEGFFIISDTDKGLRADLGAVSFLYEGRVAHVTNCGAMSIPDSWTLLESLHAASSKGGLSPELMDKWRNGFASGTAAEALSALTVLGKSPEMTPPPKVMLDTLMRHYAVAQQEEGDRQANDCLLILAQAISDVLAKAPDTDAIERLLGLYLQDFRERDVPIFHDHFYLENSVLSLALAAAAPVRAHWLESLLREPPKMDCTSCGRVQKRLIDPYRVIDTMKEAPGEDIDALLMALADNPAEYSLTSPELHATWLALAARGVLSLRPRLEAVSRDPASFDPDLPEGAVRDAVQDREHAALSALAALSTHLPADEALSLLLELDALGYQSSMHHISEREDLTPAMLRPYLLQMRIERVAPYLKPDCLAHPDFVPVLRAALDAGSG